MKALWPWLALLVAGNAPAPEAQVMIRTFRYESNAIEVPVGTRVVWTNHDQIEHTVTSGAPDSTEGGFNAKLSGPGATFSFTFTKAGTYRYFCDRHHFMRGEIRVTPTGE
jgi:plastocyanin